MSNKQTSIEWLFNELWEVPKDKLAWHSILDKAKETHKQEIIDAWEEGESSVYITSGEIYTDGDAEQYYQETFVSHNSSNNGDVVQSYVDILAGNLANPNADRTENWKEGYLWAESTHFNDEQIREAMYKAAFLGFNFKGESHELSKELIEDKIYEIAIRVKQPKKD
jgi:hypothetical protein